MFVIATALELGMTPRQFLASTTSAEIMELLAFRHVQREMEDGTGPKSVEDQCLAVFGGPKYKQSAKA
jgi:hypothetical protein